MITKYADIITKDGLSMKGWATFSDDNIYRYRFGRVWDESKPQVAWCLCNLDDIICQKN